MKKGFTLMETVVALGVILVIVLAFHASANFFRSAHQRTMATNFGILQVENIKSIFDASTFESTDLFGDFNANLESIFAEIITSQTATTFEFQITTTLDGGEVANGEVVCNFGIAVAQNWATLSATVQFKNKILFELQPYQKVVEV